MKWIARNFHLNNLPFYVKIKYRRLEIIFLKNEKREKQMAENKKIYDVTFKRMFRMSDRMLIKFVNKVFDKKFPLDSKVKFLDPNSEDEDNSVLERDLFFEICNERFQVEAQSYWDDMMFRLFEIQN